MQQKFRTEIVVNSTAFIQTLFALVKLALSSLEKKIRLNSTRNRTRRRGKSAIESGW